MKMHFVIYLSSKEIFLHTIDYFLYYLISIPDISDYPKKVHSCIDTSIFTVVFMYLGQ